MIHSQAALPATHDEAHTDGLFGSFSGVLVMLTSNFADRQLVPSNFKPYSPTFPYIISFVDLTTHFASFRHISRAYATITKQG